MEKRASKFNLEGTKETLSKSQKEHPFLVKMGVRDQYTEMDMDKQVAALF
ncbi:MAG: hypothetical protein R2779_04245 [Crocinitomicaceae bacterium]